MTQWVKEITSTHACTAAAILRSCCWPAAGLRASQGQDNFGVDFTGGQQLTDFAEKADVDGLRGALTGADNQSGDPVSASGRGEDQNVLVLKIAGPEDGESAGGAGGQLENRFNLCRKIRWDRRSVEQKSGLMAIGLLVGMIIYHHHFEFSFAIARWWACSTTC